MKLTSLARQSDLIFAEVESEIFDRGHYIAIKTRTNLDFHWGNYLIYEQPPDIHSVTAWIETFHLEFPYYNGKPGHLLFTWNPGGRPTDESVGAFIGRGFILERGVALLADRLQPPPHFNANLQVRPYSSPADWEQGLLFCLANRESIYEENSFERFKRAQFQLYQKMHAAGRGNRFGAFLGSHQVGDLGLFHKAGLGRYQNVMTHPEYLRQGICGTLVYTAGIHALNEWGVNSLVMEADADYHAARIYQSVGFKPAEENHALYWKRPHV